MSGSSNSLFRKDLYPVPGWSILTFLGVGALIGTAAIWLLPDRSLLPLLTVFFGTGLAAVFISVSPLGLADGARALGLRPNRPHRLAVAIRGYAPEPPGQAGIQVLVTTAQRWPAYAWSFPIGDGRVNVGYGELVSGGVTRPLRAFR